MTHFKLTEYTHPADVFKHQEDLRSIRLFGFTSNTGELRPDTVKRKVEPLSAGVWNLVRQMLP